MYTLSKHAPIDQATPVLSSCHMKRTWPVQVLQQRYEQLEAEAARLKAVCALRAPSEGEKQVIGMVLGNRAPLSELQVCQ